MDWHLFQFDENNFFTANNLALMGACVVAVGLIWSIEANNQWLYSILRSLKITSRTTKPSTWVETFAAKVTYTVVHLKDGRRAYGWPRFYSGDAGERAIFLENASWLTDQNQLANDPLISILLDKESEIAFFEFVNPGSTSEQKELTPSPEPQRPAQIAKSASEPPKKKFSSRFWFSFGLLAGYVLAKLRYDENEQR